MIKRIVIVPRVQVEQWLNNDKAPYENWALISIYDSLELMTFSAIDKLKTLNCKKIISLKFADVTSQSVIDEYEKDERNKGCSKIHLFNQQHARHIINFLDDIDVETLVIHCAAGISRSGAVGVFACRYFKLDEEQFMRENKHKLMPNFYVLKVLNDESGIHDGYEECWKDIGKDGKLILPEDIF